MTKEEYFYKHPNKPKKEINDIMHLISIYGENATLKDILNQVNKTSPYRYLKYKCPKCNGAGYVVKEYNAYPLGLPDSGWVYKAGYDYQQCDLCDGMGWTEVERKPITKTTIVGYK